MAGYVPAEGAGGRVRGAARYPPLSALVVSAIAAFSAVIVLAVVHSAYDDAMARTRTLLGHNLEPTPWHPFPHAKGRPPARALRRLPAAALAPAAAAGAGAGRGQRLLLLLLVGGGQQDDAAVPGLLRGHPAGPGAVAARRQQGRRDAGAPGRGAAARVDARDHHRRRAAAARGPLLRLRAEPRALHGVEPAAADAAVPGPGAGRGPHVRLHGPTRHQPHRARGRRAAAAALPVLHHQGPLRHPLPRLVLLGLAGEHRAMEQAVQEHQAGGQGDEMGGADADGVLEGQPGRGVAAARGAAGLQRHRPVARRDHAPELDRRGQGRVPALQALQPVHPQVQDLRGGVRVVGEPQVHPVVRVDGAADRSAVRGLLQPGAGAPGELLAGERGAGAGHVRVHPGRRGVGQRQPGGGGARGAARPAPGAGPAHGRRLRLHAAPAHRVRRAHGLPPGAAAHGAGGVRGVPALPRRRQAAELPPGVQGGARGGRALRHAAGVTDCLPSWVEDLIVLVMLKLEGCVFPLPT